MGIFNKAMGFSRHSSQDQTVAIALQLHVRKVSAQLRRTFPSKMRSSRAALTVALVDGATYQGVRYPFTHPRLQPAESAVGTSQTLLQRVLPYFRRSKLQEAMLQKQVVEATNNHAPSSPSLLGTSHIWLEQPVTSSLS